MNGSGLTFEYVLYEWPYGWPYMHKVEIPVRVTADWNCEREPVLESVIDEDGNDLLATGSLTPSQEAELEAYFVGHWHELYDAEVASIAEERAA